MNILHHKSWHVRTKANMERVRRDEAKAAEEEQRVLDRQIQAENERRIGILRSRAEQKQSKMFDIGGGAGTSKDVSISDETGHVNLFQDLEREERKNLGSGNKEYDEEKAKEKREWESKMGIQVYFAENTNDLDKKKEWYETMPMRKAPDKKTGSKHEDLFADRRVEEPKRSEEKSKKKRQRESSEESSDSEVEKKKKRKHKEKKSKKKKKKHKRRHRDSSEEREIEKEYENEKRKRLELLRDERMKRERIEAARTYSLLHPEETKKKEVEEKSRRPKYNSQFNPEFTRR